MKKTILVSDLSGEQIDGKSARITIDIEGQDTIFTLDVSEEEGRELANKGRGEKRRGRKKGTKNTNRDRELVGAVA